MTSNRYSDEAFERWRRIGDEAADTTARRLLHPDEVAGEGDVDEVVVLGHAVRALLDGSASSEDEVRRWLLVGPELPEWADDDVIETGQRFFARWPLPIATTLFCAALPTAYAAPGGAAILMATSHLGRRGSVARRLAETGPMVVDVMDPTTALRVADADAASGATAGGRPRPLHPGSQGYLTARSVRLLHGLVRETLRARQRHEPSANEYVPINQEQLLGTLLTFTVVVLDGLERLGIPVAPADAEAYHHTWCVVGALLGIEDDVLPRTVDEARTAAEAVTRRQLGASTAGTALMEELLREMRMAMPTGCQGMPAALVHHLVPDIAQLLQVPAPGPVWRRVVGNGCRLVHASRDVSGVRDLLMAGPGAEAGRSILQLFMDREEQAGMPPYRVAPGELLQQVRGPGGWRRLARRTARRVRRGDEIGGRSAAEPAEAADVEIALPPSVVLPIDAEDVRLIASEGFPLWEPVDELVRRNRCITLGYADLSRELAKVTARGGQIRDANWCTFAAWSSRTIGTFLEELPERGVRPQWFAGGMEAWRSLDRLTRLSMHRTNGASFRVLAAGNRTVFLETGLAIATFIDRFGSVVDDDDDRDERDRRDEREERWRAFWAIVEQQLKRFESLDGSWLPTPSPPPDDLRLGLREYFTALHTDDLHERSQHVLAGNLYLAAYEQQRVDGYTAVALALFTKRAMRRLICDRTGHVGGVRRWANRAFARLLTRRMHLLLPGGKLLHLDEPILAPSDPADCWTELADDAGVSLPVLQALIERFDLSSGRPPEGCQDWSSLDQRLRTIGMLFRLRQRQRALFDDPFATMSGE